MNILITIVLVLVGIIALLLVIGLFSKKGYTITRSITVNKPKQEVFNYVKLLKNQDFYSKWVMMDPNMKKVFTGTDGTVGFIYAWDSENKQAGKGEQELKKIVEGERTEIEIRFERPFKGVSQAILKTEGSEGLTNVTWIFDSKMKYPMNLMMLFINFDKLLGKDMETSLASLKNNLLN